MIQVQDIDSEDGSPKTINAELRGSLCGEVIDGGFVTLDGILMTRPMGRGKKTREPYFHCTGIVENGKTRTIAVSDEDEEIIRNWVSKRSANELINELATHFAPTIHGHLDVKKSIILQAVGGLPITEQRKRGDIHILLLGDPGVAKSQLLKAAVDITPGSLMYDCSQASQAGLVAAAEKKKDLFSTGESWAIQAGALALTPDHAICALDEFHLLGGKDKTVTESLNVALEAQEVRISKAAKGVVTTKVGVLMAANPRTRNARFDPESPTPLYEQAGVKVNTMSRVDFVAVMRDLESEALDVNVSAAMWDAADPHIRILQDEVFPVDNFMQKLVTLAKRIDTVYFDAEAKEYLINSYNIARQAAGTDGKVTPRRNEALRRFVQAITRLNLQNTVTLEHAQFAERLLRVSMTDTHPAIMDGGQTSKEQDMYGEIFRLFNDCWMGVDGDSVHLDELETYVSQNWGIKVDKPNRQKVRQAMKAFSAEGKIQRRGNRYALQSIFG
jgi:DNA replicative helicase MCM subunit Mcm2 (Cdc46/Mcm family)